MRDRKRAKLTFMQEHLMYVRMNLTNESYLITIMSKNSREHYFKDENGWHKVSARGRKFKATSEQVLNHLLPAMAGIKLNLEIRVEHYKDSEMRSLALARLAGKIEGS